MTREEILFKLQLIFDDLFGKETVKVSETTSPDDIEEWDSLMHISLLEAVQDEFEIKFTLDEMISMTNVGQIVEHVLEASSQ